MTAPFVIDAENIGMTSFNDLQQAIKLAQSLGCHIRTRLCNQTVIVRGDENPHDLYRKLTMKQR